MGRIVCKIWALVKLFSSTKGGFGGEQEPIDLTVKYRCSPGQPYKVHRLCITIQGRFIKAATRKT